MNLEKAIEILNLHLKRPGPIDEPDLVSAIQLGKEALKRIHHIRTHKAYSVHPSLPGEDE